jgi:NADH-quinone oxidoreductase subunit F
MAKGAPFLQNGVKHDCITPVTLLDHDVPVRSLTDYEAKARYVPEGPPGGYRAARHVMQDLDAAAIIDAVKASGIRGKGGAGFPTGMKWSFVPKDHPGPKYLVVNADESEPGTFKDRFIQEDCPHRLIEGIIIACKAIGAHQCYIYTRGEFFEAIRLNQAAVDEAYAKGYLGDKPFGVDYPVHITLHTGAGAYICGEETALLTSLEGDRGHPKMKPPFPAVEGVFRKPTVVNNVETIASVPAVFVDEGGPAWFKARGTEKSPGIKVVSVSGCVRNPGWWEIEYGTPIGVIINELAGGLKPGRKLKGIVPGGSSCPLMKDDCVSVGYDYEALQQHGSMLGSAGLVVLDDTVDIVSLMRNYSHFYKHESCGKCTPCREGTRWLLQTHERILEGGGRMEDLDMLYDICVGIEAKSFCALGDAAAWPVKSAVKLFPEDYRRWIEKSSLRALDQVRENVHELATVS